MTGTAPPLWTAQQRDWLRALGHEVLVLAADGVGAAMPPGIERMDVPGDRGAEAVERGPASPLLQALARAACRTPQDPELLATLPDLAQLMGNPAARRALWPRLRALRRRSRR